MNKLTDTEIEKKICELLEFIAKSKFTAIVVSNEVGLGIVPDTKLGRRFRDLAGIINKFIAQKACKAYFLVSGIPINLNSIRRL